MSHTKRTHYTLFGVSVLLISIALLLTFTPAMRYGTHGDSRSCSENDTTRHTATITSYLAFTEALDDKAQIGTCPYQNFYAKTYAIELWVIALSVAFVGMRKHRRVQ